MHACIDDPPSDSLCDPLCFRVEGWLDGLESHPAISAVEIWLDGRCVGRTEILFVRPDVNAAHGWPADRRTGFVLFGHAPGAGFDRLASFSLQASVHGASVELMQRRVRFIARDYRTIDHGPLLAENVTRPWHRDDIFGSGLSQDGGSPDVLAFVRRYLGPPPCSVLDIGCGLGWYGRQLLAEGYGWHGVEIKAGDAEFLSAKGVPYTQTRGETLPFPAGAFQAAMLIEVLEHIADPKPFLADVQRVAPELLLVSVPNCELVTYLRPHEAVPWHMLEADHKNFFTRWNLSALLREFYPRVEVIEHTLVPWATVEGSPLYSNLFAIASR